MQRTPLKELKDLQNEILKRKRNVGIDLIKIKSFSQFLIVKYLLESKKEKRVVYQKDLETVLNIRKSTISGILDTMEKNKIITRVTDSSSKGNMIVLENSVSDIYDDMLQDMIELEKEVVKDIAEEDLEIFYRVIDKMKENLRKEDFNV